jgi:hypothetical protein
MYYFKDIAIVRMKILSTTAQLRMRWSLNEILLHLQHVVLDPRGKQFQGGRNFGIKKSGTQNELATVY